MIPFTTQKQGELTWRLSEKAGTSKMAEAQCVLFLGETIGFWIQTGCFVLSGGGAAWAVFYNAAQVKLLRQQTATNEKSAKRRATVDVVMHEKQDAELQKHRQKFADMHENKVNFTSYACQKLTDHKDENATILAILNNYEFIASGIREEAFDEHIYKRMKNSLIIRDWDALKPYVTELRNKEKRPRLFAEFEWLAEKWRSENQKNP